MKINALNMNKVALAFRGTKELNKYRQDAQSIINDLNKIKPGSPEFTNADNNKNSLRWRLLDVIFVDTKEIGEENITDEDRALHEKLKSLFKEYQEKDDYMDPKCGGRGQYIDRTIDYCI